MMRKDNKTSLAKNPFFLFLSPLGDENMASEDDDTGN